MEKEKNTTKQYFWGFMILALLVGGVIGYSLNFATTGQASQVARDKQNELCKNFMDKYIDGQITEKAMDSLWNKFCVGNAYKTQGYTICVHSTTGSKVFATTLKSVSECEKVYGWHVSCGKYSSAGGDAKADACAQEMG